MVRQRSQPRPGLSGQLTVTTVGSDGSLGNWIKTTSSKGIPIAGMCKVFSGLVLREVNFYFKGLSPAEKCGVERSWVERRKC